VEYRYTNVKRKSLEIPPDAPECCPIQSVLKINDHGDHASPQIPQDDNVMSGLSDLDTDMSCSNIAALDTIQCADNFFESFENSILGVGSSEQNEVPMLQSCSSYLPVVPTGSFNSSLDFNLGRLPVRSPSVASARMPPPPNTSASEGLSRTIPSSRVGPLAMAKTQQQSYSNPTYQDQAIDTTNVDSILQPFPTPSPSPIDYWPMDDISTSMDLELQMGLATPAETSSGNKAATRTTITLDNPEPNTMMRIMDVLIKSQAKVRFESQ